MDSRCAITKAVRPLIRASIPCWTRCSVRVSMEDGGLVQNQHRRVRHCGPGNGQQLPLSLGEVGAVSGQHGLVAVRQPADKPIGVGKLCCGDATSSSVASSLTVADILQHSAGEQMGVLQDHAQADRRRSSFLILLILMPS